MLDGPAVGDILDSIAAMLRSGEAGAFDQRVAANAISIVQRDLADRSQIHETERVRLTTLLNLEGALVELNAELCRKIRDRKLGINTPGLLAHLHRTTHDKLCVDQPTYRAFQMSLD